jgi:hypothetical protein
MSGSDPSASPTAGGPSPRGPAERFRAQRRSRRSRGWDAAVTGAAFVVVVLAVAVILTARPTIPGSHDAPPPPPIVVAFGTPTVTQVNCTGGGMVYAERIPWESTPVAVSSGDLTPRVIELFDGDIVNDQGADPKVTAQNVCAGTAPSGEARWYGVLGDPNGSYVLTYTIAQGWLGVGGGPSSLDIQNDSSLTIVMFQNLSNSGYGLRIVGFVNGAQITGSVTL